MTTENATPTTTTGSKTLAARCKEFFGLKPGETTPEFMQEFRELTEKDRNELVEHFNAAGMPTTRS